MMLGEATTYLEVSAPRSPLPMLLDPWTRPRNGFPLAMSPVVGLTTLSVTV